ncbi:cytochrome-c peroxidase [Solirhodobacter olei]|uniref:cytochrome-c peroxidase n=1 Tax=Solirhodobacter olei TaxID=2493082 RepID=UPI000FD7B224|nr:cytochrome c peroxidase [Solirhodobacter olei]
MNRISAAALAIALCTAATARAGDLPAPVTAQDYNPVNLDEARLGQLLFYDPVLSGNRNIACDTCHNTRFGTSDGVSLDIGEGGIGLGPARHPDPKNVPERRVARNAPSLFNLGAKSFTIMFDDGRIEADPSRPSGLRTPMEDEMVRGFASVLAAQTMFPVVAQDEMAGNAMENDVSKVVREGRISGPGGAWDLLAARIRAIPGYQERFAQVYPAIAKGRPIAFTDISNALAAFIEVEWRSDTSPFDAYLRHRATLPAEAMAGLKLFYGAARCSSCHSGPFLTDNKFHAMGEPQLGPGKTERFETNQRDLGRYKVSNDPADIYAFRTPSLRNVMMTGPWGHDGAHSDLKEFIRYHADPVAGAAAYKPSAVFPKGYDPGALKDWAAWNDPAERKAILSAVKATPVTLSPAEVDAIYAFLGTLTDPQALKGRLGVPKAVPSGLPVDTPPTLTAD